MLDRLHLAARAPAAHTLDHHNKQLLLIGILQMAPFYIVPLA